MQGQTGRQRLRADLGSRFHGDLCPVALQTSIRILFAIAAAEDLEIHQMDVVSAFLAGNIDEEVYTEQPEGFEQGEDLVCLLNKALYGLKQAPRVWNQRMRNALVRWGFQQLYLDNCVFVHDEHKVIIAVYVDDLLILSKELAKVNKIKDLLSKEFEMKDMGELKYFLGIQVHRDQAARTIHTSQAAYIDKVMHRFGMEDSKPATTPIATGTQLLKAVETDELVHQTRYQSMVGSQMYAMLCTRLDFAFAIQQTSQFSAAPTKIHEAVIKRGLRYLNGSRNEGITFSGSKDGKLRLEAYSDADWAGDKENRRSISGFVATMNGAAISWSAKKQSSVATSPTEAEYMALSTVVKEVIWIQRMFKELGRTLDNGNVIYEDNQGAIALAKNPEHHA
jgi:Reverse transcriptase (RNA-dependent DNA polymerase)